MFIPLGGVEHLSTTIGRLKTLKEKVAELNAMFQQQLLDYVEEHGSVTVGQIRYYAGFEMDTINGDTAQTLEALYDATGGDVHQVAACLCSQPFKHGACKTVLPPEVYAKLFTTVEKKKAKEGKPERKVLSVNTAFAK